METWYGLLVYIGVFLMGVFGAKWSVSFAKSHHKGDETLPLGMVVLISSFIGMSHDRVSVLASIGQRGH